MVELREPTSPGEWVDVVMDSVGHHMYLETTDGINRRGKITGITCREFMFNGFKVEMPTEIEVNGDPSDRVPLDRLSKLVVY